MLNKAVIMGRLTRDPDLKYTTTSHIAVVSFTVAVDRNFAKQGEQRQTDFIDCVAWRNTAEFVSRYFKKGQMIVVCGAIQTRKWGDANGNKRVSVEIFADEVFFGESKRDPGAGSQAETSTRSLPAPVGISPDPDFQEVLPGDDDDEFPF